MPYSIRIRWNRPGAGEACTVCSLVVEANLLQPPLGIPSTLGASIQPWLWPFSLKRADLQDSLGRQLTGICTLGPPYAAY